MKEVFTETMTPEINKTTMLRIWKKWPTCLVVVLSWLLCFGSSTIAGWLGKPELFGVQIISAGAFALVTICMATLGDRWSRWRRLLFIPGSLLAHIVLTLPVASSFGILMRMADRERTIPEQKAIFILAALPILVFAMHQSRLFTRTVKI